MASARVLVNFAISIESDWRSSTVGDALASFNRLSRSERPLVRCNQRF